MVKIAQTMLNYLDCKRHTGKEKANNSGNAELASTQKTPVNTQF